MKKILSIPPDATTSYSEKDGILVVKSSAGVEVYTDVPPFVGKYTCIVQYPLTPHQAFPVQSPHVYVPPMAEMPEGWRWVEESDGSWVIARLGKDHVASVLVKEDTFGVFCNVIAYLSDPSPIPWVIAKIEELKQNLNNKQNGN